MFEGILQACLERYLAPYVDGLSKDKLSLGVMSGSLRLESLSVKKDFFALIGMDHLEVLEGNIGSLAI